jgi:hypothetical protein
VNLGTWAFARRGGERPGTYTYSARRDRLRRLTATVALETAVSPTRVALTYRSSRGGGVQVRRASGEGGALVAAAGLETTPVSVQVTRYRAGWLVPGDDATRVFQTRRFAGSGGPHPLFVAEAPRTLPAGVTSATGDSSTLFRRYVDAQGVQVIDPRASARRPLRSCRAEKAALSASVTALSPAPPAPRRRARPRAGAGARARVAGELVDPGELARAARGPRRAVRRPQELVDHVADGPPAAPHGVHELRRPSVAAGQEAVLLEHLGRSTSCTAARPSVASRRTRHCTSAVSAPTSPRWVWASMTRTSSVPSTGCSRTSHHRNVGSGKAPQRRSTSTAST